MKLKVTSGVLYGNEKGIVGRVLKGGKEKNVERGNSIKDDFKKEPANERQQEKEMIKETGTQQKGLWQNKE